jgi:uncharacterized protein
MVEHTDDGRYIVVKGRRWRATDPALPEDDAAVLRRWLMAARRDVGTATRAGDADGESAARARVQAAKTALGERGPAWWEQTDDQRRARWTEGLHRAAQEGFGSPSRAPDVEGDGS